MKPFFLVVLSFGSLAAQSFHFDRKEVAAGLKMGYQLVAVDLNGDGRKDLIAIDERASDIRWYENPTWRSHMLSEDTPRPINMDCHGSGAGSECALALQFETNPEKSVGEVLLLHPGADAGSLWMKKELDRIPTAHRVRWIDAGGDGRKALVVSPLVGAQARPPLYDGIAPVYLYRPGAWKRETIISDLHGVVHAAVPVRWRGRGEALLAAGFSGLRLYEPRAGAWRMTEISKGDPRPCPECGSSEARLMKTGAGRAVTAIEPWHGNQVVVYQESGKTWRRVVIEDGMVNGHALAAGDMDSDGGDEIVAGFRGKGYRLSLYHAADARGEQWRREIIDTGIAAADCKIEDFTGDGRPDIACIGASTGNVVLYVNRPREAVTAR